MIGEISHVAVDVETVGRKLTEYEFELKKEVIEAKIETITAPKHYKDIEKIEAYIQKEKVKYLEEIEKIKQGSGLSIFYSNIVSVSIAYRGKNNSAIQTNNWIKTEKTRNLEESPVWEILKSAGSILMYTDFDLLKMRHYCAMRSIQMPFINYYDVSRAFSHYDYNGKKIIPSLKELGIVYLNVKYENLSKEIDKFYFNEEYDRISEYNNMDAIITLQLFERFRNSNII